MKQLLALSLLATMGLAACGSHVEDFKPEPGAYQRVPKLEWHIYHEETSLPLRDGIILADKYLARYLDNAEDAISEIECYPEHLEGGAPVGGLIGGYVYSCRVDYTDKTTKSLVVDAEDRGSIMDGVNWNDMPYNTAPAHIMASKRFAFRLSHKGKEWKVDAVVDQNKMPYPTTSQAMDTIAYRAVSESQNERTNDRARGDDEAYNRQSWAMPLQAPASEAAATDIVPIPPLLTDEGAKRILKATKRH